MSRDSDGWQSMSGLSLAFASRASPDDAAMANRNSSPLCSPLLQRLTRYASVLEEAVRTHDQPRAHRSACEIRDLGWSAALPGPAAMAGVLAMRLSDEHASSGEIDLALDETLAEVRRAISRLV